MKILVSACLLGTNCTYKKDNNFNLELVEFLKNHQVIPICPEVFGGLLTPREPAEIKNGKVINKIGQDVTREYNKGAIISLRLAIKNNIDFCILKSNSPSCGNKRIYDGNFNHNLISGEGITAKVLKNQGFLVYNEKELKKLKKIVDKRKKA